MGVCRVGSSFLVGGLGLRVGRDGVRSVVPVSVGRVYGCGVGVRVGVCWVQGLQCSVVVGMGACVCASLVAFVLWVRFTPGSLVSVPLLWV